MTVILWIVVAILSAFLLLIVGVYAGMHWHDNDEPKSDSEGIPGPRGFSGQDGKDGDPGRNGKDGDPGPPGPGIKDEKLENGMYLKEWIDNVNDRLNRVERRSGMSV